MQIYTVLSSIDIRSNGYLPWYIDNSSIVMRIMSAWKTNYQVQSMIIELLNIKIMGDCPHWRSNLVKHHIIAALTTTRTYTNPCPLAA